jgi:2,3-bisphosphoglycerate-dependent phosphoglycerate mutase
MVPGAAPPSAYYEAPAAPAASGFPVGSLLFGAVMGTLLTTSMAKKSAVARSRTPVAKAGAPMHRLVLVRHGESTWNDIGLFTGWADPPLSEKGLIEAREGGKALKEAGYEFDVAYTSMLSRAIQTLWGCLTEVGQEWIPVEKCWRLNERHYGSLQGLDKKATVEEYGSEQVQVWRRSYDIPPPDVGEDSEHYPGNDRRYNSVPEEYLPLAESLKLTEKRVLVEWDSTIAPAIRSGQQVLIAAHGNSLRALTKYLDDIPADKIAALNIPTGVPLVYELDADLKPIKKTNPIEPLLSGMYLGDQEEIKARIAGVVAQTAVAK